MEIERAAVWLRRHGCAEMGFPSGGIVLAANGGPRVPSGGVILKRRCTYRPSVIYLIVNKLPPPPNFLDAPTREGADRDL